MSSLGVVDSGRLPQLDAQLASLVVEHVLLQDLRDDIHDCVFVRACHKGAVHV